MTTPASDKVTVKGKESRICNTSSGWFIATGDGPTLENLTRDGEWSRAMCTNYFYADTRAAAEAFLLSKSDTGDERGKGDANGRPTCGVLYAESVKQFAHTEAERRAFASGHVSGQAEKVYLGACEAAMFRPQPEKFDWLLGVVQAIAIRYGLSVNVLPYEGYDSRRREIWISRHDVGEWLAHKVDSPTWHVLRGVACGVPYHEIDHKFHERRGYNEPCDGKPSAKGDEQEQEQGGEREAIPFGRCDECGFTTICCTCEENEGRPRELPPSQPEAPLITGWGRTSKHVVISWSEWGERPWTIMMSASGRLKAFEEPLSIEEIAAKHEAAGQPDAVGELPDEQLDRERFEERAFAQRFLMSIRRNPSPPQPKISGALDFVSVDCPDKADFIKRNESGSYIDRTLDAMWWAWKESRNWLKAAAPAPAEVDELRRELAEARLRLLSAAGDDLCRLSQDEIKELSSGAVKIPPKEEFLASCERFHQQIADGPGVLSNCLTLAQLIAECELLRAERDKSKAELERWATVSSARNHGASGLCCLLRDDERQKRTAANAELARVTGERDQAKRALESRENQLLNCLDIAQMQHIDAEREWTEKLTALQSQVEKLQGALRSFAFTDRAQDAKGPCFCKYVGDDYNPDHHSGRCLDARAALAPPAAALTKGAGQ